MTKRRGSGVAWGIFALACATVACSEPPRQDTTDGTPVAPAPGAVPVDDPGAVVPGAGSGPATGPAGGAAGQPALPPPSAGGEAGMGEPPAAGSPAVPEACEGFVVSRSRPCHDDPDPCGLNSGFAGDEYCLPPPAPGEGVQVHFGPSDYSNPAEVEKYLLRAGQEFNDYGIAHVPTTEDRYYNRVVYQMRPGSHHLINSLVGGHPPAGFQRAGAGCPGQRVGSLGGTQNLVYDSRPNGIVPPESEGLGYVLPGNSSICFNYHRYNATDQPQLSEIWVNFYFVDEAEVTQRARWGAIIGGLGMRIPPGAERELTYDYTFGNVAQNADSPARIIQLFGHRHASTYRFAAWLNEDLIYDSWDWQESITFNYDSLTTNPDVDPDRKLDGGHSGMLPVKSGDVLKYSCFIRNETQVTLTFANELYTAEMCNLFGQAVGTSFSGFNF
jgi:hypothetical protein